MHGSTQTYLRCWTIPCLDSVLNHHPRKANVQMQCTTPTIHDACMHQTKSSTPTLNPKRLEMYLVRCAEKDITMHTHPALRTLPLNIILFHSFSISLKTRLRIYCLRLRLSSRSPSASHLLALMSWMTLIHCLPNMTGKEMTARIQGTVESILFALPNILALCLMIALTPPPLPTM
jgi:hypothetical protein